jgi:hypothetical protein
MKFCVALCLALFVAGCATTAPIPPLDLNAPGWQVRQAQAIWKPGADKPEIVGDLVISTNQNSAYLQFSKTLPIASARTEPEFWQVEFPPQNRRYSGRGAGPKQIVWLQLLHAVTGRQVAKPWSVQRAEQTLLLENGTSGEHLEVHF